MSDEAGVIAGGEVASAPVVEAPITTNDTPLSTREAWGAYKERAKREQESTAGADTGDAAQESAVQAGAAPQSEVPGETQATAPAELPTIEPRRDRIPKT